MMQHVPNQEYLSAPQQQMAQPMMICPMQLVCDPQMMIQPQETMQQNQTVILNVQNVPPWIQQRQNLVYYQQIPTQYQPYNQLNMIQNPVNQYYYPIQQPMNPESTRQVYQLHTLVPHQAIIPTPVNTETEKMPILTQMLNQKPLNFEKPVMMNQDVQTEPIQNSNYQMNNVIKPQMMTVNPIQKNEVSNEVKTNFGAANNNFNIIRPPLNDTDVPTHIKHRLPNSISVRTVYRPILPRPGLRPYEFRPNVYVNPYYNARPEFNGDTNIRAKIQENLHNKYLDRQVNKMYQPALSQTDSQENNDRNITNDNDARINDNDSKINDNDSKINDNSSVNDEMKEMGNDDKLIRNTVYIQARGRVMNEKEIIQNESYTEENKAQNKSVAPDENKLDNVKLVIEDKGNFAIGNNGNLIDKTNMFVRNNGNDTKVNDNKNRNEFNDKYVLTHVVDGNIIQESNVAFPIAKRKEKTPKTKVTSQMTQDTDDSSDSENQPLVTFRYHQIVNKLKENDSVEKKDKENPFSHVKKSTVQSWKINQLVSHLNKYNWKETATILSDEEIDGESLLLVSREQLISIGVSENHADIMYSFIKS